ncbi:DUF2069 domain-containing protein [Luteimonas sp. FXH3W]|jgi:uncharacterized membrane protein|uniref:DUF2069 domain-containing protein n=1 Tax=Aquilutibacter rugosus TaxID=3115820 RepID=A0ABU7UXG8_9GAMM
MSNNFPEFDPQRKQLSRVTALALLLMAALYWYGTYPDMGAALVFAIPPLLMSILVWIRRPTANLLAGVLALLWFAHSVMTAYVSPQHRVWSLAVAALCVIVIWSVSWVGLKVRRAKRRL